MSSLLVPVTQIAAVRPHPNADTLDIAQVLGWQVIVKRGSLQERDRVVYFPPDTVLSEETALRFGVTNYLDRGRVRSIKLRGEYSHGLAVPIEDASWETGQNMADYYGATKWEPPLRSSSWRGGRFVGHPYELPPHELFPRYTEIENMRHFPDLCAGEVVVLTEKIHGTNSRIGMVDGEWMAGSHRMRRGEGDALYWSPRRHATHLVEALSRHHKQVILYGEIYGEEVQSLAYGAKGYEGYAAFDLLVDGRYASYLTFEGLCREYAVPMVPLLAISPFEEALVISLSSGTSVLPPGGEEQEQQQHTRHLREGVVIRPLLERHDPQIGRVVLKYVSDEYLVAKKTDFADI